MRVLRSVRCGVGKSLDPVWQKPFRQASIFDAYANSLVAMQLVFLLATWYFHQEQAPAPEPSTSGGNCVQLGIRSISMVLWRSTATGGDTNPFVVRFCISS